MCNTAVIVVFGVIVHEEMFATSGFGHHRLRYMYINVLFLFLSNCPCNERACFNLPAEVTVDHQTRNHSKEMEDDVFDPFDIDKQHFNPDLYLNKLLQEYSLSDLIERKDAICKSIVSLDSEMKTLVYENYNKFISATDTIRKVRSVVGSV